MDAQSKQTATLELHTFPSYEAPRIELILTSEELEREVIYAGIPSES